MKPFLTTEELLRIVGEKQEPIRTVAMEALRLHLELEALRQGVRAYAASGLKAAEVVKDNEKVAAAFTYLSENLKMLPEQASEDVEEVFHKMLGPLVAFLYPPKAPEGGAKC